MPQKYHLNILGKPTRCTKKKRNCIRSPHFNTEKEAINYFNFTAKEELKLLYKKEVKNG